MNYRYTFTNRCHEVDGLELNDGATKIFLNTKGLNRNKAEQPLIDFLHYVRDSRPDNLPSACDDRLKRLHAKITEIKASEQMEVTYMTMEERDRLIREQGERNMLLTFIRSNRADGIPDDQIAAQLQKFFQISSEETDYLLQL